MGASKAEKIPHGTWRARPGAKRWMKKVVRRARRRAERDDPENAPTRPRHLIRGWYW